MPRLNLRTATLGEGCDASALGQSCHSRREESHNLDLDRHLAEGEPRDEHKDGDEDGKPKLLGAEQRIGVGAELAILDVVKVAENDKVPRCLGLSEHLPPFWVGWYLPQSPTIR